MKLGKLPAVYDTSALRLAHYLDTVNFAPPATLDLTSAVTAPFPMDDNDRLGDCTCAAAAHLVQVWSAAVGLATIPTVTDVVAMYETITRGRDVGANEHDVLTFWRTNPHALDSSKSGGGWAPRAFVACNPNDDAHIKAAASLFGGVYIGLQLPASAQHQVGPPASGKIWDTTASTAHFVDAQPGSWGGHAVNVVGYDADAVTVVTWGALQKMTWRFWMAYCDEAWAILPNDWEHKPGIHWSALEADLRALKER